MRRRRSRARCRSQQAEHELQKYHSGLSNIFAAQLHKEVIDVLVWSGQNWIYQLSLLHVKQLSNSSKIIVKLPHRICHAHLTFLNLYKTIVNYRFVVRKRTESLCSTHALIKVESDTGSWNTAADDVIAARVV